MKKSSLILSDLQKSEAFLADVLAQPINDYMRAAAIQSFEVSFLAGLEISSGSPLGRGA
jgi:hypothetical protein